MAPSAGQGKPLQTQTVVLEPVNNERLANLSGHLDEHLHIIENRLGVDIAARGELFQLKGEPGALEATERVLRELYAQTDSDVITPAAVNLHLQDAGLNEPESDVGVGIKTRRGMIRGRGPNQRRYLERIASHDVSFGVGPAGTGKTFLAVWCDRPSRPVNGWVFCQAIWRKRLTLTLGHCTMRCLKCLALRKPLGWLNATSLRSRRWRICVGAPSTMPL
jgi:hypothetical protein